MAAVLGFGMVLAGVAAATTVTMTFDELETTGLAGGQYVADCYNGGAACRTRVARRPAGVRTMASCGPARRWRRAGGMA